MSGEAAGQVGGRSQERFLGLSEHLGFYVFLGSIFVQKADAPRGDGVRD